MPDSFFLTLVNPIRVSCVSNSDSSKGDAILSSNLPTPLKGVAIGNGWIDAKAQYPAYLDYSVKHGLIEENSDVSLISSISKIAHAHLLSQTWKSIKEETDKCLTQLAQFTGPEPIG